MMRNHSNSIPGIYLRQHNSTTFNVVYYVITRMTVRVLARRASIDASRSRIMNHPRRRPPEKIGDPPKDEDDCEIRYQISRYVRRRALDRFVSLYYRSTGLQINRCSLKSIERPDWQSVIELTARH